MTTTRKQLVVLLALIANCMMFSAVAPGAEPKITRDIPYVTAGHERQVLDVHAPTDAKSLPVVFWIHGGGW